MAFLNKLNRAAKTAAKSAAEIASEAIGSGKIAVRIKREELQIEQQYEKIGEYFYKRRNEGLEMPSELEEYCVAIDIALATIKELEEMRGEMKDGLDFSIEDEVPYTVEDCEILSCAECGKILSYGNLFCPACGTKVQCE